MKNLLYSLLLSFLGMGTAHAQVFPAALADSLAQGNYSFTFNNQGAATGGAFHPTQIIVEFQPNIPQQQMAALRAFHGAVTVTPCLCNHPIEVWDFGAVPPNGVQGKKQDVEGEAAVKSADLNYYTFDFTPSMGLPPAMPMPGPPAGLAMPPAGTKLIAILDTGIDYMHDSLRQYVWRNDENVDGNDNDGNCVPEDFIGWNFVNNNNNPNDDHGHGTHVAGIVVRNMRKYNPGCNFRIMPLKTHDQSGIGTLFAVTCATYYAADQGAHIINDSWGWYGGAAGCLSNAILYANNLSNTLVNCAAGNDSLDITPIGFWPAKYLLSNVLSVAAIDSVNNAWQYTNYSSVDVDIAAYGKNILSTLPANGWGTASGTSMATPSVSALAAMRLCCTNPATPADLKNDILGTSIFTPAINGMVLTNGRIQFPGPNCQFCTVQAGFTFSLSNLYCRRINFSNTSTGATSYFWNFGDPASGANNTSTGANPFHSFTANGIYTVCLTATSANGCSNSYCTQVQIGSPCTVSSQFCYETDPFGNGAKVKFDSLLTGAGIVNIINFGDGSNPVTLTTQQTYTKTYANPGTYNVCITTRKIVCGDTCCQTCCKVIEINPRCNIPTSADLNFSIVRATGVATLTATAVTGATYEWNFGNGITATTQTNVTTHTYANVGTYTACVTIRVSANCSKSICRIITWDPPCNVLADFKARICANEPNFVRFTSKAQNGQTYSWDFGDGTGSNLPSPTHYYSQLGVYTVCYSVSRGAGCVARTCYRVVIGPTQCSNACAAPGNRPYEGDKESEDMDPEQVELPLEKIDEMMMGSLEIVPVPATEFAMAWFTMEQAGSAQLEIYDLNGHLVAKQSGDFPAGTQSFRIPTDLMAQGMYFVRLAANGELKSAKMVVSP